MNIRIIGLIEAVLIAIIAVIVPGYAALKPYVRIVNVVAAAEASPGEVDGARIAAAAPGEWLSNGRTYSEQRFSPLKQIDASNVKQARRRLGIPHRHRARPRGDADRRRRRHVRHAARGARCWALDAKTGKQLWPYDPEVPGAMGPLRLLRCRQSRRRAVEGRGLSSARSTAA